MNYVSNPKKLPIGEHFAALNFKTISEPGYDAGDPPSSREIVEYISFEDREEMVKWVTAQENPKFGSPNKNYKVVSVKTLPVTVKVDVIV